MEARTGRPAGPERWADGRRWEVECSLSGFLTSNLAHPLVHDGLAPSDRGRDAGVLRELALSAVAIEAEEVQEGVPGGRRAPRFPSPRR